MANGLQVRGLVKSYDSPSGKVKVLSGVTLEVAGGETAGITGPSGSGKSTLLNIIGTLDTADAGSVQLNGQDVLSLKGSRLYEFRNTSIGFVFQDHHLLPQLTALENVMLPSFLAAAGSGRERALELLSEFGLSKRKDFFPSSLSGGERQRVAAARALINSPKLLLCDEPTGNLDEAASAKTGKLFLSVAKKRKIPIVIVTHNLELAKIFSVSYIMHDGKLIAGDKK